MDLAESFVALVRERSASGLASWLELTDPSPTFRHWARSLQRDEAAVRAGMRLPWSNGPVEGAIHRLKLI